MSKLIRNLAIFVFCLASISGVHAATLVDETLHKSKPPVSLGVVKDTAGMDALVNLLQDRNMVAVALAPLVSQVGDKVASSPSVALNSIEEASQADFQMLIAGLVLVAVIALRRMSW